MINPYADVVWSGVNYIQSLCHAHIRDQERFDRAYNTGIRHFALTRYHPSIITYPLEDFFEVPFDAIGCPNTEHLSPSTYGFHHNSIGSLYEYESDVPVINSMEEQVDAIVAQLIYPGGGGITINHPGDANRIDQVNTWLDYSPLVLGIEILNTDYNYDARKLWDNVLNTGRRCWGFCVPDHTFSNPDIPHIFRNVLLTDAWTELACAVAYRKGAFYGCHTGAGCKFTNISLSGGKLTVTTDTATSIKFIANRSVRMTVSGNTAVYGIRSDDVYVRIEATDGDEVIFSNPIMLKTKEDIRKEQMRKRFLLMS